MKSCVPTSWSLVSSAEVKVTPVSPLTTTVALGPGKDQYDGCSLGGVTSTEAEGSQTPEGNPRLGGCTCFGKTSSKTKIVGLEIELLRRERHGGK